MQDDVYFRAGVGLVVIDDAGFVLAFERSDVPGAWQLPQGGLIEGENPITAAARELLEETGISWSTVTMLDEHPDWLAYELPSDARTPKTGRGQIQKWFLVRLEDPGSNPVDLASPDGGEEFRRWRWMRFPDLIEVAWYPRRHTYTLLQQRWADHLDNARGHTTVKPKRWRWTKLRWPWRRTADVDRERLDAALSEFRHLRERLASEIHAVGTDRGAGEIPEARPDGDESLSGPVPRRDGPKPPWLTAAEGLERAARRSREAGAINTAWSKLKAANRHLYQTYKPADLLIEAQVTAMEGGEKLRSWRKTAVERLLEPYVEWSSLSDEARSALPQDDAILVASAASDVQHQTADCREGFGEPAVETLRRRVVRARLIVDEAADNTYIKQDLLRIQLRNSTFELVFFVLLTFGLVLVAVNNDWRIETSRSVLEEPWSLAIVLVLGALSAALSGLMSLLKADESRRIPAVKLQGPLLIIRPFIGAVAALIVVAILQSGLGGLDVDPQAALLAAFIAGFSERVVSRAVSSAETSISGA